VPNHRLLLLVAAACLLLASGAAAAEGDAFTATSTPSHVKPAASASYTITLTNDALSPSRAQKAKIAIPTGFVVDPVTVGAISEAVGGCTGSTWEHDGTLIANSKINLKRPGGSDTGLCPGAKLTVSFAAKSASTENTYTWTTQLFIDATTEFLLNGSQPTVVVDGTPPETTINSAPASATTETSASFSFSSSQAGSTFECSLDGAAFAACTSPKTYTGLDENPHTFAVKATDLAGNTDATPANESWTIDITAPNTTIASGPPPVTNQTNASFSFSASQAGSTFECSLDGAFAPCTSPKTYPGLGAGPHTFEARATDPAGNTDASPATHTWVIDLTPPNTTITSPGPPALTNQTTAGFSFVASEADSTFQCRLDGAFAPCTSPKTYPGLGAGPHAFEVRATDPAGNTDASPAARSWTVDLIAPETTITSAGPPAVTNQTSATFTFSSEPGATFQCSLDAFDDGAFAPCTSPTSYTGLPGGSRTFQVRASDPAGNTDGSPAARTWRIDLIGAATTILTGPPSLTNSTSAGFVFAASEAGTTFECSLDRALFTACGSPTGYSSLADGPHTFAVRAVDSAGNTGPEAAHNWLIDTRPPTGTVGSGPPALTNSRSATFTFSADEPSSFQCSFDGGSLVPCGSPASYTGLGDGAHTFLVRPTDAVGNAGAASSYAWTIDATAPETTLGSRPRSGTTAVSATFTFSATEAANFQCKLDAAAFAPCASPKSYAALKRTGHTFEVRAIDSAGNVDPTSAVYRWTIGAALRRARAASALLAPRAGARVTSPPVLRWRRVARASYYNVQLYRGRVKVLSAWPTRPRLQLGGQWTYLGRQRRLARGTYRWLVWPRFGRRYGALLGQRTFTVVARR
jgi:hypothetical protein